MAGRGCLGQYLSTIFDRVTIRRRRFVGIVRDARSEALRTAPRSELYVPYLEGPAFSMTLLVRTELEANRIVPALRIQMATIDPDLTFVRGGHHLAIGGEPHSFAVILRRRFTPAT